jgi:ABC-2 type transport system permease protein
MLRRIREIIVKELRQTLREPRMRAVLFVPPMLQLIIFGYAVNLDVEDSRIAWLDGDRTPESRELRAAFEGSPYFRITHEPAGFREAQELLDRGRVIAAVTVLPGFGRDIERGETAQVQILIDGSNSNTASVAGGYAGEVVASFSAARLPRRQGTLAMSMAAAAGRDGPRLPGIPSVAAKTRVWFNEDLRSRNYFVPGVLVNIITLVTLMLTAMAIVREREIGTMEQLMVTPIRPIELILGKTLPFAAVGMLQVALVTGVALVVFRVPFRGEAWLLLLSAALFLLTTLGAGLFISTVSSTQQQAMMGSFFFFMPAFMLSGFAFPIRNMPPPVQWLSYLNPVRYFMATVRGLFLKGAGIETLWPQLLAMALLGAAIVVISASRFHKRLD